MSLSTIAIDLSPLKSSRQFGRLYTAGLLAMFAGELVGTSLFLQVHALAGPVAVGLVGALRSVAMVSGLLVGGYLADRLDKRFLIAGTGAFVSILMLALAINACADKPSLVALFFIAAFAGAGQGLSAPAAMAAAATLVAPHQFAAIGALNTIAGRIAGVLSPIAAGFLMGSFGETTVYAVGSVVALSGGALSLSLSRMQVVGVVGPSYHASMSEALAFVRTSPIICAVLTIDFAAMLFATPFSLIPNLAGGVFGGGPETAGLLYSAPATGALLASLLSGWIGRTTRPGRWLLLAALMWPVAITAFGLSATVVLAIACLAIAGFADATSEIIRTALVQANTPSHLRGRVNGIWLTQALMGPALGNIYTATVAGFLGPSAAIVIGGLMSATATIASGLAFPVLRRTKAS
ncbi:MFS transporter [Bradyrhizobium sp. CCGB01]|uniref:MFS transporter n=1 Tax=Bradyrhizobium sp. CCGB01 TaxID=2949634 RepID=UPI0020B2D269|nr:MFS transporter [Bradyrhizobium sp. CCGB01]MCP3404388.1 MFS transporter [Bradyrhizobium sp. CCGB01]